MHDSSTARKPEELVEHFFRHEYGRLVSLLARTLGVRHLQLAEDVVQTALSRALQNWARHGVPNDPSAWLYRTARNLAIDALRRQSTLHRIVDEAHSASDSSRVAHPAMPDFAFADEVSDEPLRLLLLCCHPSIALASQVALALKMVGGFSVVEIANGLLAQPATIEKRLARAKAELRSIGVELAEMSSEEMLARRPAALVVLYLLFNEGFSASGGDSILRRDLCEEAVRLLRMIVAHPVLGNDPASCALLALMLFHSSRFNTRIDDDQCVVLLAKQDRSKWDWEQIREAMQWMLESARGTTLTRYHIEAAIAWEHCRAATFEQTDWSQVSALYDRLQQIAPGAMVRLNAALVVAYCKGPKAGMELLRSLSAEDRKVLRPWWDCAMAELYEQLGEPTKAGSHWTDALALARCQTSRNWIEQHLSNQASKF